jgi:hypothetical protein
MAEKSLDTSGFLLIEKTNRRRNADLKIKQKMEVMTKKVEK